MGIIATAALVLIALVLGAALTMLVERLLTPHHAEPGPAQAADVDHGLVIANSDRWLLPAGPVVALIGVALAIVVVPFGPGLIGRDLGIGVFYVIVVIDFVVLGLALAGWGADTANAVEACYRIIAQLVAYVVPLGLAYVGVIMMARSLSTITIMEAQRSLWFVVLQPIGFVLYLVTGLMQSYRAPFLEPFAASIGGGVQSSRRIASVRARARTAWSLAAVNSAWSLLRSACAAVGSSSIRMSPAFTCCPSVTCMAVTVDRSSG